MVVVSGQKIGRVEVRFFGLHYHWERQRTPFELPDAARLAPRQSRRLYLIPTGNATRCFLKAILPTDCVLASLRQDGRSALRSAGRKSLRRDRAALAHGFQESPHCAHRPHTRSITCLCELTLENH